MRQDVHVKIYEIMDQKDTSDDTMVASYNFNHIMDQITKSCLNYQVQVTPFSAVISLKKTLARNKDGVPLTQTGLSEIFLNDGEKGLKYRTLEAEFNKLQEDYKALALKHTSACESLNVLAQTLNEREDTIKSLEASNVTSKAVADKINKSLVEKINMFDAEKKILIREYEGQVKM